jgi:hypothetical protein|tara:strand:- start:93 stop:332 length:240 start_codon:yes stop_codon:yes gene_type:complete
MKEKKWTYKVIIVCIYGPSTKATFEDTKRFQGRLTQTRAREWMKEICEKYPEIHCTDHTFNVWMGNEYITIAESIYDIK